MFRKETVQINNESFENRLDRLTSRAKREHFYGRLGSVDNLAEEFGSDLVGITIETSADDFYVIRDIVVYDKVKRGEKEFLLMAFEATRLDHHSPGRPHIVKIHPSATVQIADSKKLLSQFGTRYRQILEEINAEDKHHIEIPPKRDPFAR